MSLEVAKIDGIDDSGEMDSDEMDSGETKLDLGNPVEIIDQQSATRIDSGNIKLKQSSYTINTIELTSENWDNHSNTAIGERRFRCIFMMEFNKYIIYLVKNPGYNPFTDKATVLNYLGDYPILISITYNTYNEPSYFMKKLFNPNPITQKKDRFDNYSLFSYENTDLLESNLLKFEEKSKKLSTNPKNTITLVFLTNDKLTDFDKLIIMKYENMTPIQLDRYYESLRYRYGGSGQHKIKNFKKKSIKKKSIKRRRTRRKTRKNRNKY